MLFLKGFIIFFLSLFMNVSNVQGSSEVVIVDSNELVNEESDIQLTELDKMRPLLNEMSETISNQHDTLDLQAYVSETYDRLDFEVEYLYIAKPDNEFIVEPFVEMPESYVASERVYYQEASLYGEYMTVYQDAYEGRVITLAQAVYVDGAVYCVIGIDVKVGSNE